MKKEKIKPCLYLIVNTVNDKKYVGQTIQKYNDRMDQHKRRNDNCTLLNRAIEKYGWENFIHELIEYSVEESLDRS